MVFVKQKQNWWLLRVKIEHPRYLQLANIDKYIKIQNSKLGRRSSLLHIDLKEQDALAIVREWATKQIPELLSGEDF